MRVPSLIVAALALLFMAFGCTSEEEVEPGDGAAKATAAGTSAPTPDVKATAVATPVDTGEWQLYSYPGSEKVPAFSFSYPSGWFIRTFAPADATNLVIYLTSWDPASWTNVLKAPPESMKIDVGVAPLAILSECGQAGGETAILGGVTATKKTEVHSPANADGITQWIQVDAAQDGFCYTVFGSFSQADPDLGTFDMMLQRFRFGFQR